MCLVAMMCNNLQQVFVVVFSGFVDWWVSPDPIEVSLSQTLNPNVLLVSWWRFAWYSSLYHVFM